MRPADDGKKGNVIPLPRPSPQPVPRRSLTPYLSIAAGLIVAVGIGFIVYLLLRPESDLDRGLVALNESYQERPVEARLSDLRYAPMPDQRGAAPRGDYVKRELAGSRLRTAATENPNAASLRALGQWYLTERKFDEAIDQFNKALALDPNDAKSHVNMGAAWLEKGKLDVSKTEGGRSVENFSRSLEQLNKGLQLDSSLLEGYFNRALVYEYMMLPREAEAAWREYLQKDSNSQWAEEAKRNLKQLEESNNRKAMTIDDTLKEFRQARRARDDNAAWKLVTQHYTSAGNELSNRLLDSLLALSPADTSESPLSDLSYLADLEQKQRSGRAIATRPTLFKSWQRVSSTGDFAGPGEVAHGQSEIAEVLLLAACKEHQRTLDGTDNGVFTKALLDVWNTNGSKTYAQLMKGISQKLTEQNIDSSPVMVRIPKTSALGEAEAFRI
ncbi:MAG TPA: tetratricopeptide repeat protein [Pyrinomonadaceae bacterium]|nr:tetratricopeptide repeat protein [Pyrinomonadaceae bacterium]